MKRTEFIKNIAITIGGTTLFSCESEIEQIISLQKQEKPITISQAKKWYLGNQKNNRKNSEKSKNPIWEDAIEKVISINESMVVVPLVYNNTILVKTINSTKKEKTISLTGNIQTNIIFRNIKGKIEALEMIIVPSESYNDKKKGVKINNFDFDGIIYFVDEQQKLSDAFKYEKGKIIGELMKENKKAKSNYESRPADDIYYESNYIYLCFDGTCTGSLYNPTYFYGFTSGGGGGNSLPSSFISFPSNYTLAQFLQDIGIKALWDQLNNDEKDVFRNQPYLLPAAYLAANSARILEDVYFSPPILDSGNSNAFRHAYWSALLSFYTTSQTSRLITDAHETGDLLNAEPNRTMDYNNNTLGRNTYLQNRAQMYAVYFAGGDYHQFIAEKILQQISIGNGKRRVNFSTNDLVPTDGTGRR